MICKGGDCMSKIDRLIKKNKGYITYSEAKKSGISYNDIKKKLVSGEVIKEDAGIYKLPDMYVDEYFTLQYRYHKGIYTLETALWLHGLSVTVPFEPVMSFPYGTNTKLIKEAGVRPVILRSNYNIGIVEMATPGGQSVKVYEKERVLAECLRPIYKMDVQIIAPAFKSYASAGRINYAKLLIYAKMFKVEDKVLSYLEVIG